MIKRNLTLYPIVFCFLFLLVGCSSDANTITNKTTDKPIETSKKSNDDVKFEKMFSIKDVSKKTSSEISSILGAPEKSEESPNGITNFYMNGNVQVYFVDDIAAKITIYPNAKVPFYNNSKKQATTLGIIGLDTNKIPLATSNSLSVDTWENVSGIYQINIFNNELKNDGNDTVGYIYIITDKIYK